MWWLGVNIFSPFGKFRKPLYLLGFSRVGFPIKFGFYKLKSTFIKIFEKNKSTLSCAIKCFIMAFIAI